MCNPGRRTDIYRLLVLVTWGGIRRIGNVAEKLVPAASGIYIAFSMIVILSCLEQNTRSTGIHGNLRFPA